MLIRTVSGAILTVLLAAAVLLSHVPFLLNAIVALLAAAGVYEILKAAGLAKNKTVLAVAVPFTALFVFFSDPAVPDFRTWLTWATYLLVIAAFLYYLRGYKTLSPAEMLFAVAITLIVAYFFSAAVLVRRTEMGLWHLILVFLLAWIPDTGAYFCGSFFGKHKLAPVISPKKTVEGALGGIAVCVTVAYLYAFLVAHFAEAQVSYPIVAVYAVLGTAVSVLGDLSASLIKRHYKIKDYGTLIPGHGGIMDRFDSVWFTAPFVWMMMSVCPMFS